MRVWYAARSASRLAGQTSGRSDERLVCNTACEQAGRAVILIAVSFAFWAFCQLAILQAGWLNGRAGGQLAVRQTCFLVVLPFRLPLSPMTGRQAALMAYRPAMLTS